MYRPDDDTPLWDPREHRAHRFTRTRLQLELNRAVRPAVWIVLGAALAAFLALYIDRNIGGGSSKQEVSFVVDDATAVVASYDEVRVLGIPAGRITEVKFQDGKPVVTGRFDTKRGAIYRNARAVVRPNTPLQDMYLDVVDPGTPSAGRAGAGEPLSVSQTQTSVNINDVLDVFQADERQRLRALLDTLGNGLHDRGAALREAFVELAPLLTSAHRVTEQVAVRKNQTKRLVHNASALFAELARRDTMLRRLVDRGGVALSTVAAHRQNLDAVLRRLAPALGAMRSSLASASGVLDDVDGAVRALAPVASRLPAALADVRALNRAAAPAVSALHTPIRELQPLVATLPELSHDLGVAVGDVVPHVPTINRAARSLAGCKTGVQGFFQWNPSFPKYGDVRGHSPRGNLAAGGQTGGLAANPFQFIPESCAPGRAIGGRVPKPEDKH
jgi:phospholipid/cholesterol/gamma-HCH transport system substrate-binding protein